DGRLTAVERQSALRAGCILGGHLAVDRGRALAIQLVQAVLQVECLTRKLAEVDDDIHPFRGSDAYALHLDRMGDQVAVGTDQVERIDGGQAVQVRQEEFVNVTVPYPTDGSGSGAAAR